jgi:hypothetical protein
MPDDTPGTQPNRAASARRGFRSRRVAGAPSSWGRPRLSRNQGDLASRMSARKVCQRFRCVDEGVGPRDRHDRHDRVTGARVSAAVGPTGRRFAATAKSSAAGFAKTSSAATVVDELLPPGTRNATTRRRSPTAGGEHGVGAERGDHTGDLVAGSDRQRGGIVGPAPGEPLAVRRVHAGREDCDRDLTRSGLRHLHPDNLEHAGSAVSRGGDLRRVFRQGSSTRRRAGCVTQAASS